MHIPARDTYNITHRLHNPRSIGEAINIDRAITLPNQFIENKASFAHPHGPSTVSAAHCIPSTIAGSISMHASLAKTNSQSLLGCVRVARMRTGVHVTSSMDNVLVPKFTSMRLVSTGFSVLNHIRASCTVLVAVVLVRKRPPFGLPLLLSAILSGIRTSLKCSGPLFSILPVNKYN